MLNSMVEDLSSHGFVKLRYQWCTGRTVNSGITEYDRGHEASFSSQGSLLCFITLFKIMYSSPNWRLSERIQNWNPLRVCSLKTSFMWEANEVPSPLDSNLAFGESCCYAHNKLHMQFVTTLCNQGAFPGIYNDSEVSCAKYVSPHITLTINSQRNLPTSWNQELNDQQGLRRARTL